MDHQKEIRQLTHQIALLLAEWDPISVGEQYAYSEYESYAEPILTRCKAEQDIRVYLREVFTEKIGFDWSDLAEKDIDQLATKIFSVLQ